MLDVLSGQEASLLVITGVAILDVRTGEKVADFRWVIQGGKVYEPTQLSSPTEH